jgi:hypothetical protein
MLLLLLLPPPLPNNSVATVGQERGKVLDINGHLLSSWT